jgi:hypothetical protein
MEPHGKRAVSGASAVTSPVRAIPDGSDVPDLAGETAPEPARRKLDRRVVLGIVVAILVIAAVVWFVAMSAPSTGRTASASNTSISSGADAIVASAAQSNPAGFVLQSSRQPSSRTSDWAVLEHPDGSEANVTVVVYSSAGASQRYFDSFVAGVRSLPGYTNVTSDLASFQQYGKCYGYGEDVDTIAVINGVCTKGNVFLQVHLVSSVQFSDLEGDLTGIMGALYQNAA